MQLSIKALLVGIVFIGAAAADTSAAAKPVPLEKPAPIRVLVVSGQTELEALVVFQLAALLKTEGCVVKRLAITEVQRFHPENFDATVLMGAVSKDSLKKPYLDFVNQYGHKNSPATIIIARVSGEEWQEKQSVVDAVTGASMTSEPTQIAKRIQQRLDAVLKRPAR
jgi:hypothetical protein